MDMFSMGTARNYVKNMELNIKWKERKEDPLKPKEDSQIADIKRKMADINRSNKINSIKNKLIGGSSLDKEDLEYLRIHSPEDYENAVKVEKERQQYKKELENCRSKEDVEKLNQRKLTGFCAEARAIASNPNIPKAEKIKQLEFITMKVAGAMSEYSQFKETDQYRNLPQTNDEEKEKNNPIQQILTEVTTHELKQLFPQVFAPEQTSKIYTPNATYTATPESNSTDVKVSIQA